jgi:hypothetical protein
MVVSTACNDWEWLIANPYIECCTESRTRPYTAGRRHLIRKQRSKSGGSGLIHIASFPPHSVPPVKLKQWQTAKRRVTYPLMRLLCVGRVYLLPL